MSPQSGHRYLRSHRLAGDVLSFSIALEDAVLRERAASAKSGRAAKTLVKEGRMRVTLVALRKDTALGGHAVQGEVTIQVLRGAVHIGFDDRDVRATKGSVIALQAGVAHDVWAVRDAALLITNAMR